MVSLKQLLYQKQKSVTGTSFPDKQKITFFFNVFVLPKIVQKKTEFYSSD